MYLEDFSIKALNGRTVTKASINKDHDLVVLETTTGPLYLTWEGDCCAHCFLENVSGVEYLVGATIIEATNAQWVRIDMEDDYGYGGTTEIMGTNIRTDKGYVTFESRVNHNGYYGGSIIVNDQDPLNGYHGIRSLPNELVELEDF